MCPEHRANMLPVARRLRRHVRKFTRGRRDFHKATVGKVKGGESLVLFFDPRTERAKMCNGSGSSGKPSHCTALDPARANAAGTPGRSSTNGAFVWLSASWKRRQTSDHKPKSDAKKEETETRAVADG